MTDVAQVRRVASATAWVLTFGSACAVVGASMAWGSWHAAVFGIIAAAISGPAVLALARHGHARIP